MSASRCFEWGASPAGSGGCYPAGPCRRRRCFKETEAPLEPPTPHDCRADCRSKWVPPADLQTQNAREAGKYGASRVTVEGA